MSKKHKCRDDDDELYGVYVPLDKSVARAISEGAFRTRLSPAEYFRRAVYFRLEADGVSLDRYFDDAA